MGEADVSLYKPTRRPGFRRRLASVIAACLVVVIGFGILGVTDRKTNNFIKEYVSSDFARILMSDVEDDPEIEQGSVRKVVTAAVMTALSDTRNVFLTLSVNDSEHAVSDPQGLSFTMIHGGQTVSYYLLPAWQEQDRYTIPLLCMGLHLEDRDRLTLTSVTDRQNGEILLEETGLDLIVETVTYLKPEASPEYGELFLSPFNISFSLPFTEGADFELRLTHRDGAVHVFAGNSVYTESAEQFLVQQPEGPDGGEPADPVPTKVDTSFFLRTYVNGDATAVDLYFWDQVDVAGIEKLEIVIGGRSDILYEAIPETPDEPPPAP